MCEFGAFRTKTRAKTPTISVEMPVIMRMIRRQRRGVGISGVGRMSTRTVVKVSNNRDTIA